MAGSEAGKSVTLRAVKANAERSEIRTKFGAMEMNQITLRLCDKNQEVRLDPSLKMYTSRPLRNTAAVKAANGKAANAVAGGQETGKVVSTYAVQELAGEEVAGFKTRHYLISTKLQMSGCVGNSDIDTKVEIWVADIKDASACADSISTAEAYAAAAKESCQVTYEQKGDVAAYAKAYNGLIVRQKIYNGDQVLMTTEMTSLSQAKLDDTLFTIPGDYKKVSEEEFQRAQSQAMMEAMIKGQAPIS